MRIEFNQGVPKGAIDWLWENVGKGNRVKTPFKVIDENDSADYDWFFERIAKPVTPVAFGDDPFIYVPTITVKDEQKAIMFALKWL